MTGEPKNQSPAGNDRTRPAEGKSLVGSAFTSQSGPLRSLGTAEEVDESDDD